MKETKVEGMILTPDSNKLRLYLYADAEFSGLFAAENKHDPISVKSGTGIFSTLEEYQSIGV